MEQAEAKPIPFSETSGHDVVRETAEGHDGSEYKEVTYPEVDEAIAENQGYEDIPTSEVEPQTSHIEWEDEAKKFQSMYDKSQAESQKLNSNVREVQEQMRNLQQQIEVKNTESNQIPLSEEEFNPWDAYYKPDSPSYQFRAKQEQENVNRVVQQQLGQMNEQVAMNNTVNELKGSHKLNESELNDFMQWSTNPVSELSLGTLVKVWREESGSSNANVNSLDAVKAAKQVPRTAGVLQGQQPIQKSDEDQMWDGIMTSGGRFGNKLP